VLFESIEDSPDEGVEAAWTAEIERRMAEYQAGSVTTIPWSEVRAHLHRTDR
jgi:putative addiction module component (TIGR02574 family)